MGAWIETINGNVDVLSDMQSHPVWVRGLKLLVCRNFTLPVCVAPRVGAWIETYHIPSKKLHLIVAPRVGAWIETGGGEGATTPGMVAPRVGAWIETPAHVTKHRSP